MNSPKTTSVVETQLSVIAWNGQERKRYNGSLVREQTVDPQRRARPNSSRKDTPIKYVRNFRTRNGKLGSRQSVGRSSGVVRNNYGNKPTEATRETEWTAGTGET